MESVLPDCKRARAGKGRVESGSDSLPRPSGERGFEFEMVGLLSPALSSPGGGEGEKI